MSLQVDLRFASGIGERERPVAAAFVALATGLVNDRGPADVAGRLAEHCARLLDVDSVGVLLADSTGAPRVVAASDETARLLEDHQVRCGEGPGLDCHRTRVPVSVPDLRGQASRWPEFVHAATESGYASVHALPLCLGEEMLGTLDLFGARTGVLDERDLHLAQALARVAGIALVTNRTIADQSALSVQLQTALNGRVVLEQAKGLLAQAGGLGMEDAFEVLRRHARSHQLRLGDVAEAVVSREIPVRRLLDCANLKPPKPGPDRGRPPRTRRTAA